MSKLLNIITNSDPEVRDTALAGACSELTLPELLEECIVLDQFRREAGNLYERVRALFFLSAIHRFHLPPKLDSGQVGLIPFEGQEHLLRRRFAEAIDVFHLAVAEQGASESLSSALAQSYHELAFQALALQVRRSVRTVRGNQWMFRMGHPADHPLSFVEELVGPAPGGLRRVLRERTPVRMDLSHAGWSDIFFLGMDHPEGARVLNVSVDLGDAGLDHGTRPPIEAHVRVIDDPVIALTSVDLMATARIGTVGEIFDFGKDALGLLKAAVIASGVVPPGIEGSGQRLENLLERMVGPGKGIEIVSWVHGISKGSRLAVSTNLLAALIAVLMRATGQTAALTGTLRENERRLVLARAILGEWLGGSGGGWQDSGGVWPGIKLISGVPAGEGDPEFGVSRGRLLPEHHVFGKGEIPESSREALQDSLVLVHGGMTQNVGPILEMVTEKYLLRSAEEWKGRKEALVLLEELVECLKRGDMKALGQATTRNFRGPIQRIIPWATNLFTETLIARAEEEFGEDFWGFWMLGGMSGGGMGFIFAPARKPEAQKAMLRIMEEAKDHMQAALPFGMSPVVYNFSINDSGTRADLLDGEMELPAAYFHLQEKLVEGGRSASEARSDQGALQLLLEENGFDRAAHEAVRADILAGRVGLESNRLSPEARIEDVSPGDVLGKALQSEAARAEFSRLGEQALVAGEVAVVTLAAGAASRWTGGAGTCKALNPFAPLDGRYRTFLEVHLAKSRKTAREHGCELPHIVTTSYLTHGPTSEFLEAVASYGYEGPLLLSPGRAVGLRMVPTERDLQFAWEETPQQQLDVQQQKLRDSSRAALLEWARACGEASDYTDNLPGQCLHPMGHFYEIPNLILNGTLSRLLQERPQLKTLLVHNVDTLGASVDPVLLGRHLESGHGLSYEVIIRHLADRGGGLSRVDGKLRLVEGLAMPDAEAEFRLSYYNSMTTWVDLDHYLSLLGLTREEVMADDRARAVRAVRELAARMPTYLTIKNVRDARDQGQQATYPVAQVENLWGDLTTLPEANCGYFEVERRRGQQLKEPSQLDSWLACCSDFVRNLCEWE
ncbi:MAG: UTP--glucose-1-phosphate uridylyltransferase [Roseibacillus sp.]|nr:UTP--glucose-1-phosphate uridylyltransferase [Roseibacillus sp.]